MKTKLQLIILCLLLSFVGGSSVIQAADSWEYPPSKPTNPFAGGDGSKWNPYRIDNAQQLANFSYMVTKEGENYEGKYFVLTNDITLNDNVLNDSGTGLRDDVSNYKEWTPIGDRSVWDYGIFKGIFDGQGHTIRGMVCAKTNEREYTGLFETIEYATIKNINMEDCCIKDDDAKKSSNFGILCGEAWNTCTIINCTISKSAIIIKSELDVCVGGILGSFKSIDPLNISNCSFNGYISFRQDDYYKFWFAGKCIGGILGFNNEGKTELHFNNCSSSGDIDIYCSHDNEKYYYYIGGLGGNLHSEHAFFSNCVSSMNINIDSPNSGIGCCDVGGIVNYVDTKRSFSNCVYLGKIRVGYAGSPAKMEELKVCGIGGSNYVNGCAFYGKMDIHCKATHKIQIAGITIKHIIGDNYKQNIVYSAGNVIDIDAPTTKIDQVCNEIEDGKKHKDFYCFGLSNGESVDCRYSYSPTTYNKSLDQLKADNFISTLNQDAGSNVWGKMTGTNSDLDGLPMPIACGGKPLEYTGEGTPSNPYVINSENDLNRFKEYVNNGSTFEGKYFKLGSDISITGTLSECIGFYKEKPFKGHLDGNGHAIVGLRNQLFGYMYGTVKNLALIDCNIESQGWTGAIAGAVGDETNKAEVSNCYVSGVVQASGNNQILLGGICGNVASGSSVHDSYFKGHLIVEPGYYNGSSGSHYVGGISGYNGGTVDTTTPQGIYNCYASFEYQKVTLGLSSSCYLYGISNGGVKDCYVVTSATIEINNLGCTKLNSESELNGKFNGKSGWLQGVYRPILASAKKYKATTPEETPTTVYFDAIPEANPKKNYFYNISIENPYSDVSLWQLPNMAVYVPSEHKDYITNGYLDQSADFQYKRSAEATATAGQLRYDLKQNASGYHMLCLPGVVERGDLPQGSKVMIYGKISGPDNSQTINEVHVDTIPAGVPCILYIPTSTYAVGSEIPLVMRSEIRSEPLLDANYSNMKGTFKTVANVSDACTTADKHEDGEVYFKKSATTVSMKPFTAWFEGAKGNVKIVDYVLLDEENEAMTVTLAGLNSTAESPKTTNVKMRRTVKLGQWNTICLPFNLTKTEVETVFGAGTKVEELSSLNYDETSQSYTLVFAAVTETDGSFMKAGIPYLIKPGTTKTDEQTSVQLYAFTGKNIICPADENNYLYKPAGTEVTNTEKSTSLTMQGEYNHRMISPDEATDGKTIYVISGNKIYHVNSDVEMKGFRCYFVAEESAAGSTAEGASLFSSAKVMHADGTSTDLRLIKADTTGEGGAVYDLLGRKCVEQTKGIVIENGKKIIIK